MPKFNMYQSLHTTVIGPGGKPVEMQIRTHAMHRTRGVRHRRALEVQGAARTSTVAEPAGDVRRDGLAAPAARLAARGARSPRSSSTRCASTSARSEVYVFTPKGDVDRAARRVDAGRLRLRGAHRGRPPLHRRAGQRQAGARSESTLDNGDIVEIFTSKAENAGPSRDWLAFVKSPRARTKIRQWFAKERREEAIEAGKTALSKAMRKAALPLQRLLGGDAAADDRPRPAPGRRLRALRRRSARATSRRSPSCRSWSRQLGGDEGAVEDIAETVDPRRRRAASARPRRRRCRRHGQGRQRRLGQARAVLHAGARRRDPRLRHPRRRGVGAPRTTAPTPASCSSRAERLVEVEWAPSADSTFVVSIQVEALDRHRLLSDVTRVLSDERVNILSATVSTTRDRVAVSRFTFEMAEAKHLGHLLRAIRNVEGVYDVLPRAHRQLRTAAATGAVGASRHSGAEHRPTAGEGPRAVLGRGPAS